MAIRIVAMRSSAKKIRFGIITQKRNYAIPYLSNAKASMTYLDSGVRVITSPSADLGYSTVGVYVYSGSAFEDDTNNGVSSVIKHLVPLGNTTTTQAARAEKIESVGGSTIKVHVGRDQTSFETFGLAEGVPTLVKVLSDVIHPQDFTPAQVETARSHVFSEKAALCKSVIVNDYAHSAGFQNTPFAQSTLGETNSVKSLTSASVKDFISNNFVSNRVVVVGTGSIEHESFLKLVDKNFCTLPTGPGVPKFPHTEFTGSEIRIRDDSFHTLKSFVGFEAAGYNSPHYWAVLLLQEITGSWNAHSGYAPYSTYAIAEIFSKDRVGLKYKTLYHPYRDTGLFGFYVETDEASSEDAVYEVQNVLQKVFTYISPEELQGAKNRVISSILSASSGIPLSNVLGTFGLYSKVILHPSELVARVQAVQFSDIQNFIDKYCYDSDPVVVCYGPSQEFPDYNLIRSWTYWNRW